MHNDQENGKNIMTSNEIIDRVKELKYVYYLIYMQKLFLLTYNALLLHILISLHQ